MRDARPQGREERRAGRDRELARRSRPLIEETLRIAAAILVDALAFLIWNLATRSPARVARDLVAGLRRPATFVRGAIRFAVGLLLLVGSVSLLLPLMLPHRALMVIVTWTTLTGLLVEQIVGPDLHARFLLVPRDR